MSVEHKKECTPASLAVAGFDLGCLVGTRRQWDLVGQITSEVHLL